MPNPNPNSNPKVSVLIPVFNKENYVVQAVQSALDQTYPQKEVVVADDLSGDKSWGLLQKYQNHPQVRLFRNSSNLGRTGNHRHLLYNLSSGAFAVMLDGDDYFVNKNFIADAVKLATQHRLPLVFAEAKVQNLESGQIRRLNFPFAAESELIPYQEIFRQGILFMHGAVLYCRHRALATNFYSQNIIADDNESFLRLVVGERVGFIKRAAYLYRQQSSAARFSLAMRLQNDNLIRSVYQHAIATCPQEQKLFDWWRKRMRATFFYGNLANLASHRKYNQIREYLATYLQKNGPAQFFQSLHHPLTAWRWGNY